MAIQPISAMGREDQAEEQHDLLTQSLKKQEESRTTLHEMIQDAKEKANDQREEFKLAKATPRYGDAPLEAYARLNRAKVLEICDLVLRFCGMPISPEDILQKVFRTTSCPWISTNMFWPAAPSAPTSPICWTRVH